MNTEYDLTLERPIPKHPLFKDNLGVSNLSRGHCSRYFQDLAVRQEEGVFDTLFYLAVNFFSVSDVHVRLMRGARVLFRHTFDALVDFVIARELADVLTVGRVVHICKLLEGEEFEIADTLSIMTNGLSAIRDDAISKSLLFSEVIFSPPEHRTDEDKAQRKERALVNFQDFLRPIFKHLRLEEGKFEEGTQLVFSAFQNPVINKQASKSLNQNTS